MANLKVLHSISDNFYESANQSGTVSLKPSLQGDVLTIKYMTVVQFAEDRSLHTQVTRANEQALQMIDSKMAEIKDSYREAVDETLKVEDLGGKDDIELISMAPTTPRKVAYYRYNRTYRVS